MRKGPPTSDSAKRDAGGAGALITCAALALVSHAGMLFAWKYQPHQADLIRVLGDSVEVALVESATAAFEPTAETPSAPAPASTAQEPQPPQPISPLPVLRTLLPPEPEPAPVAPAPELPPVPEPPAPAPLPEPQPPPKEDNPVSSEKPAPASPETPKPKLPSPSPKPAQTNTPSSTSPSNGSGSPAGGEQSGKPLGVPLYLVRPQVNYPSGCRTAGEQGLVLLRITVNANGRPTAVSVATSSGFSRLDRAAVEGGWRCRVSNAFEGAQFEAPLRFSLKD